MKKGQKGEAKEDTKAIDLDEDDAQYAEQAEADEAEVWHVFCIV